MDQYINRFSTKKLFVNPKVNHNVKLNVKQLAGTNYTFKKVIVKIGMKKCF